MASHIATEEWQSFELRMRRRRAERMLVRAQAALDGGSLEDAGAALDEARRLCPSLPALDEVQGKIARASARALVPPLAVRVRRSLTIAAAFAVLVTSGVFGWRLTVMNRGPAELSVGSLATPAGAQPAATQPTPATQLAETAAPTTPAPAASIKVETERVPPVVISDGIDKPSSVSTASPDAALLTAANTTEKARPSNTPAADAAVTRLVGTTGPTAPRVDPPAPTPADVAAIAALGTEPALPAPAPPSDRVARVSEPSGAPADFRPPEAGRRADAAPLAPSRVPAAAVSIPKAPDDTALVRSILEKYADAYTRLDADAAKAVWPTVNRAALSKAFNDLSEQRIAFADCNVAVNSTQARATCSGSATWEPKIGGGPRTDARRWAFDLEKNGDDWIIREARVQNR